MLTPREECLLKMEEFAKRILLDDVAKGKTLSVEDAQLLEMLLKESN